MDGKKIVPLAKYDQFWRPRSWMKTNHPYSGMWDVVSSIHRRKIGAYIEDAIAEFGGYKDSGYGRESGFQAMYDYTRPKTVWMNTSDAPMANPFVMR